MEGRKKNTLARVKEVVSRRRPSDWQTKIDLLEEEEDEDSRLSPTTVDRDVTGDSEQQQLHPTNRVDASQGGKETIFPTLLLYVRVPIVLYTFTA